MTHLAERGKVPDDVAVQDVSPEREGENGRVEGDGEVLRNGDVSLSFITSH
jgi:hypothetical protein